MERYKVDQLKKGKELYEKYVGKTGDTGNTYSCHDCFVQNAQLYRRKLFRLSCVGDVKLPVFACLFPSKGVKKNIRISAFFCFREICV